MLAKLNAISILGLSINHQRVFPWERENIFIARSGWNQRHASKQSLQLSVIKLKHKYFGNKLCFTFTFFC